MGDQSEGVAGWDVGRDPSHLQLDHQLLLQPDVRRQVLQRRLHLELRDAEELLGLRRLLLARERLARAQLALALAVGAAAGAQPPPTLADPAAGAARGRLGDRRLQLGDPSELGLDDAAEGVARRRAERARRLRLPIQRLLRLDELERGGGDRLGVLVAQPPQLVRSTLRLFLERLALRRQRPLARARRAELLLQRRHLGGGRAAGAPRRRPQRLERAAAAAAAARRRRRAAEDGLQEGAVVLIRHEIFEGRVGLAGARAEELELGGAERGAHGGELRRVRVAVDDGAILDVLRAVGVAQRSVFSVSSRFTSAGETHAIISVRELPPSECCSIRVSTESRYGTWTPRRRSSPRAEITLPNTRSE